MGASTPNTAHIFLQNSKNHRNRLKNHPRNAPTAKNYKKAPSGRSQTSEIDNRYNTFSCSPTGPEVSNETKKGAEIEVSGTQNRQKSDKRALGDTTQAADGQFLNALLKNMVCVQTIFFIKHSKTCRRLLAWCRQGLFCLIFIGFGCPKPRFRLPFGFILRPLGLWENS